MRLGGRILAWLAIGACGPDTGLLAERRHRAGQDSGAGFREGEAILVDPPAGAIVPRNLAAVTVRLPPEATNAGVYRLRPAGGPTVTLAAAEPHPCPPPGSCVRLAAPAVLAARVAYWVDTPAGASIGGFTTGSALDHRAPRIADLRVEALAGCVGVRFSSDEPALAEIIVRAPAEEQVWEPILSTTFDRARQFPFPAAGSDAVVLVRAVDWAGNRSEATAPPLRLHGPLPPLAITEVLANPAGSETTQEFVELRNLGPTVLSLEGLFVDDAAGSDALPPVELAPGAYALIVGAGYSASERQGPGSGTAVLTVEGRIGRDGLGNAGEVVRLRRADGAIVSRYGGWVDNSASVWNGRSVHRVPEHGCDHPETWSTTPLPSTPGR